MKTFTPRNLTLAVCLLVASALQSFAIEGIKLSVHCPDVWLFWPSEEGENYIVQWRADLSTNSGWVSLTNSLPAGSGTNQTIFVHTNRVDCPTGQIFGVMMADGGGAGSESSLSSETQLTDSKPAGPVLVPKDGSRAPVPLGIYPPGLDLSGYTIIWPDGSTDEWSKEIVEKWRANRQEEPGDPQPEDGGGSPGCGFYRVVRTGIHLFGLTNGTVLKGIVELPIEIGVNVQPSEISLLADNDNPAESTVITNAEGRIVMQWNTSFAPNGTHAIWIEGAEDFVRPAMRSATNSVIVDNEIGFNDFVTTFGSQMWISAELKAAVADFQVEVLRRRQWPILGADPGFNHQRRHQLSLGFDRRTRQHLHERELQN